MDILDTMLVFTATYWPPTGQDKYGAPLPRTPRNIRCRWEDSKKALISPDGRTQWSKSKVYVDRDLEVGGRLALGALSTLQSQSANCLEEAYEIIQFDKLPTLDGDLYLRTAYVT